MTYEELTRSAQEQSKRLQRYAAVVEIVTYRTGRSRYSVAVSTQRLQTRQRGCEFVGVVCQFRNGEPCPTPS